MNKDIYAGFLVSDFNLQNLASYLENSSFLPKVRCSAPPFGQVVPTLIHLNKDFESKADPPDFAVLWTQPEAVVLSFKELFEHRPISAAEILAEANRYASLLVDACRRIKFVFLPIWVLPTYRNDFGLRDLQPEKGISDILMRMNLKLAEKTKGSKNIFLLNTQKWIETAGARAFDSKLWYMAKIPYGNEVFLEAAKEIKASLSGLTGKSRKMIVLDLDGILWKETVGEVGWENLTLGGHDPIGEAYVDFQQALKSLARRGIILGIVSKNDPAYALEAIDRHPEMALRTQDFAGWEINWGDKAEGIVNLAKKLNLGLDSIVFIDDNPAERSRVREALPEVMVPDWPEDPLLFKKTLLSLRDFCGGDLTEEDLQRSQSYADERGRLELYQKVKSYDEWLEALDVRISVEPLNPVNRARAVQLLNKTNQMNLSTRRMTELEFEDWALKKNHYVWTFSVSDKFGDYGLTGLMSFESGPRTGRLVDFLLSCRVLGKRVEEAMIFYLIEHAKKNGIDEIHADFLKTARNQPCFDFFQKITAQDVPKQSRFILNRKQSYPKPKSITLTLLTSARMTEISSSH